MNSKERLNLAHWAAKTAKKQGASDVAINISNDRDVEVSFRDKQVDILKESTQSSLGLTIYSNERYSTHRTNDLRKSELEKFIENAVAMTQYLSKDPFRSLPDPKYYEGRKTLDLKLEDKGYPDVDSDKRVKMARELEEITRNQDTKIITCTSFYSDTFSEAVKVLSNGFEGDVTRTSFQVGAEVTVDDGTGGRPEGWFYATTRMMKDIPSLKTVGEKAAQNALKKIGQTKMESGKYEMVIENRANTRLIGVLNDALDGFSLYRKSSFLDGKLGQKIGSDKLTWIDDPFVPSGLGSQLYDGEGLTAKKRTLIDKGVLKSYYIDTYYGKRLEMEPTTGGNSNLVFEYGDKTLDDLVKGMTKGILVTGFIGGNANGTTGDFSYGIVGMYVENGKIVKPVNEMNLSGNMNDFWHKLAAVGNDPYPYSAWRRPSMYFTDVDFSGK